MKIEEAKVLVVDDDSVMRLYILNLLNRLGVRELREAVDGETGLRMIASFRPDLVMSDIHMKPVDGREFLKLLRSHAIAELRKTPVLITSADRSTLTLNETMAVGIAGYIIKPPLISALKLKLEQALANCASHQNSSVFGELT